MSLNITKDNSETILGENDKLLVIDFWAPWCGPCKILGPTIDELAVEYEGKAVVAKANVDENKELAGKFGVRNIPTVLFLKNNEVLDKQIGVAPKNILKTKIDGLLS